MLRFYKSFSFLLVLTLFFFSFKGSEKNNAKPILKTQSIPVYNFEGFKHMLNYEDDKTYIINFWATWCKPCVKEMPYFEKIGKNFKDKNVEVILVSLDFPNNLESRVLPFIEKNNLKSRVVLLDDANQNRWIPLVSETWSGAIPATLIYNKNKRTFYEQSFTYEQLLNELKLFL